MNDFEDGLIFEVDFNDLDKDGRLKASRSFATSGRKPAVGEAVLAHDDEGNECGGTVAEVRGSIVYVELDRTTWRRLTMGDTFVSMTTIYFAGTQQRHRHRSHDAALRRCAKHRWQALHPRGRVVSGTGDRSGAGAVDVSGDPPFNPVGPRQ